MLGGDKLTKNIRKGLVREDPDISGNDNNGEAEEEEPPTNQVLWTIDEWHHPPHITMTRDGVEFGEMWSAV